MCRVAGVAWKTVLLLVAQRPEQRPSNAERGEDLPLGGSERQSRLTRAHTLGPHSQAGLPGLSRLNKAACLRRAACLPATQPHLLRPFRLGILKGRSQHRGHTGPPPAPRGHQPAHKDKRAGERWDRDATFRDSRRDPDGRSTVDVPNLCAQSTFPVSCHSTSFETNRATPAAFPQTLGESPIVCEGSLQRGHLACLVTRV